MAAFQGADVDGLDRTAQTMLDASDAATAVATALQAIVVALEAMSWTGFAAALAAYLKGVVIPWVKATAAALKAFGQILQLASSTQRETSGDRPVVTTGGGSYQTPQLPTASAADGPRIATIEIHITNGQTGQGSGVQVTAPALPGQVAATPIQSGGTGAGVTPTPAVTPPVQIGSGSVGSTGGASGGGGATGGAIPSGAGSGGAGSSGAGSSGWGGSIGVSSRPDGGLDVQGSFHGTIGGDPTGTTTPTVPISGHSSLGGPVSATDAPGATGGGLNSALLAAPLGLAGLGAAALGGRSATAPATSADGTTGTTPATGGSGSPTGTSGTPGATPTTPTTTPGGTADESGWRVLATSDAAGHLGLALVPDTDTVPTALDVGTTGAEPPRVLGWFDGDGDYGFVADDLVFTTPAGQVTIDHLTLQGNVADDPAVATAVRGWWAQALAEGSAASAATTTPIPSPALAAAH